MSVPPASVRIGGTGLAFSMIRRFLDDSSPFDDSNQKARLRGAATRCAVARLLGAPWRGYSVRRGAATRCAVARLLGAPWRGYSVRRGAATRCATGPWGPEEEGCLRPGCGPGRATR